MKAAEVVGGVLAAAAVLLSLAVLDPSVCVVLVLGFAGAAILFTGTAQHRTPRARRAPGPPAGAEPLRAPSTHATSPAAAPHATLQATITVAAPPVADCTDEELCWQWRRSFLLLSGATEGAALAHVAAQRGVYLDELERRHPERFLAWIGSGARAGSDPTPFFRP